MGNKAKVNPRVQKQQELKERLRKKVAAKNGPKKICLNMIVRNESANMKTLLDSLVTIIDMISIVDTGSTDNTKEIIQQWGDEHKIPTTVHFEPFQNFAYNRTHSIQMAQKTYPEADYFLLSDADFIWKIDVGGKFDKTLLVDHKYLVDQYNNALVYANIRMLSARVKWECFGVTHEFWGPADEQPDFAGEIRTVKIKTLTIFDHERGGFKAEKFTRDERLLRAGLADPKTPPGLITRYKFYLAQTLKDMGSLEESIEWYTKRAEITSSWAEERFYSKFQLGFLHEQIGFKEKHCVNILGKTEKTQEDLDFLKRWNSKNLTPAELFKSSSQRFTNAAINYLAAYNFRKTRAESLYYMVRMYRLLGLNEMAYKYAIIGNKIPFPEEDSLFIERNIYSYMFDFEISIVAYYLPEHKDHGRECLSRLLERDDLQDWMLPIIEGNCKHYL